MNFLFEAYIDQVDGKAQRKIIDVINNHIKFRNLNLTNEDIKNVYEATIKNFADKGGQFKEGWMRDVVSTAKQKVDEIQNKNMPRDVTFSLNDALVRELAKQNKEANFKEQQYLLDQMEKFAAEFKKENGRDVNLDEIKEIAKDYASRFKEDKPVEKEDNQEEEKLDPFETSSDDQTGRYTEESFNLWCKFGDNLISVIRDTCEGIGLVENVDYRLSRGYTESNYIMCPYYNLIAESYKKQLFSHYENSQDAEQKYLEPLLKNNIICLFFLKSEKMSEFRNALRSNSRLKEDFKTIMLDIPQMKDLQYIVYNILFKTNSPDTRGKSLSGSVMDQPLATICSTIYLGKTRMIFNLNKLKKFSDILLSKEGLRKM